MINWEYFRELEMKVRMQEALDEGRAEGMQQGERVEKLSTARRMKAKDCDISFIMEITGLSLEEVEAI